MELDAALGVLRDARWVDLTHAFAPGIPHYSAFPDEVREVVVDYDEAGFRAHRYSHIGQWGTHVDPPAHFLRDGATLDQIPVREMLLELVVLDAGELVAADPGLIAPVSLAHEHEARHGRIPAGAFVALRTGWSARWPDPAAMANAGTSPGWSVELVEFLVSEREVAAIGHETTDTDAGSELVAGRADAERRLLGSGRWQVELMASLDGLPERGALLLCAWPKPLAGTGFPARCVGIVPA